MSTPMTRQRGFSLIELMIAFLIGLVVIGGAVSLFVSNRQTSRTTENLSRMQENSRIAFEMMSRDIREAAGNPCSKTLPIANVLKDTTNPNNWWANWGDGIFGYDNTAAFPNAPFGTTAGLRVSGTDAIEIKSGSASPGVTVVAHNPVAASIQLNVNTHELVDGDVVMICDYAQASLTQITNASSSSDTIVHNTGTGTPGNCTKTLGYPVTCGPPPVENPYQYKPNSIVAKLSASRWYIGNNGRGGRSLYRADRANNQEIAEGVDNLQLRYLVGDNYVAAAAAPVWRDVTAVEVAMTVVSNERVGTGSTQINRTLTHIVTLRNRAP